MLATDIRLHETPALYRRFCDFIDNKYWNRTARNVRQEIQGNRFLKDFLHREHAIALQLKQLGDEFATNSSHLQVERIRPLYPAVGFMAQVLSLSDTWPQEHSRRLRRRVQGALNNPADVRGLRLELSIATHFTLRSWSVQWPETIENGSDTFDLLVDRVGEPPMEIECKSFGEDTGRKVPRRAVLDFIKYLKPYLMPTIRSLIGGLSITVTIPDRLPTNHHERADFARNLGVLIEQGVSRQMADGTEVRIDTFDPKLLTIALMNGQMTELRATVDNITATVNRQAILIGTAQGGCIAIAIQSARDDKFLKTVFDRLSDAADRQLTRRRAGFLVASIDGLSGHSLRSVALDDQSEQSLRSALWFGVNSFLGSVNRDHVVGLVFLSESSSSPTEHGSIDTTGGTAYYFPKHDSPYWDSRYVGLFKETGIESLPG